MGNEERAHIPKQHMQWTQCELYILSLLGQQRALNLEHLPSFLRLFEQGKKQTAGLKSSAHNAVERLQRAGLVTIRRFEDQNGSWVWLTKAGLRYIGINSTWSRPARTVLPALHAANTIRLTFLQQYPEGSWTSRQQLRRAGIADISPYSLPTAVLECGDGTRVAVHAVLRLSGTDEQIFSRILQQLQQEISVGESRYTELRFYVTSDAAQRLQIIREKIAASVSTEVASKVRIFTYRTVFKKVKRRGGNTTIRDFEIDGELL